MRPGRLAVSILPLALAAACAQPPSQIKPDVARASSYSGWSCQALAQEDQRLAAQFQRMAETQRAAIAADVATTLLIGVPLSGGAKNKEIALLKGGRAHISARMAEKHCAASG